MWVLGFLLFYYFVTGVLLLPAARAFYVGKEEEACISAHIKDYWSTRVAC